MGGSLGPQCLHLFSRLLVVPVCHGTSPVPCGKCVYLTVVFPFRPARRCEQTAQVRVASPTSAIRRAPQKYRIAEAIPSARSAQTTSTSPTTVVMTMLTLLEYPAQTSTTGYGTDATCTSNEEYEAFIGEDLSPIDAQVVV